MTSKDKLALYNDGQQRLSADPERVCKSPECRRKAESRGYCASHYMRLRRGGDPSTPLNSTPDYWAWIKEHCDHDGDKCLMWPFGVSSGGYGYFQHGKGTYRAHREMCRLANGEPPFPEAHAAHSCGVRECVNPSHLRWATARENMADKRLHGTHNSGSLNGMSKLTEAEAAAIKQSNWPTSRLARYYGISASVVSSIRSGKAWVHV